MKVITLTEPWATLVVIGAKQFETRSWQRAAQGRLLVHAAKGMPGYARDAVMDSGPIQTALCEHFGDSRKGVLAWLDAHRGKIIGSVTHIGCLRSEDMWEHLTDTELAFGDYNPNRYGWELVLPVAYKTHVPVRGALGIWNLPADVEPAVRAAAMEAVA